MNISDFGKMIEMLQFGAQDAGEWINGRRYNSDNGRQYNMPPNGGARNPAIPGFNGMILPPTPVPPGLVQKIGDVVKGPPNWFNQGLPVKGIDPLAQSMGQQGVSPAGPNWWMGMKPNMKPSAKDSAQTSFGIPPNIQPPQVNAPMPAGTINRATPRYDAMVGKLQHAGATMKQLDQGARNQYSAWAHGAGFDVSKIPSIIGAAAKQGLGRDQFLFMLAKLRQDGEL